jgi:imidazole glycerol-phosphate synthase subunit HisH
MITIVDYGVGNTGALLNMFDYLGIDAEASDTPEAIARASQLVLPGVGTFDKAMTTLRARGLVPALDEAVLVRHVPVLGVCLGMQLLARRSEEGNEPGLGWINADVRRIELPAGSPLKVPHIGWQHTRVIRPSRLFATAADDARFYFDHSYHLVCDDPADVLATIDYGTPLCCAAGHGHITGVQFHPEKSHRQGMQLLAAFAALEAA